MGIIITGILCIIVSVGFFFLDKFKKFKNLPYIVKQIIIGVTYGIVASIASVLGVVENALFDLTNLSNVRDAAPISAGLLYGGPAGIIAGVIGGIFRLFVGGETTRLACSIATIISGCIAGLLRKFMFDNKRPSILYGIGFTLVCEVIHMLMIFVTFTSDSSEAFDLVRSITLPMVIWNIIVVGSCILIVTLLNKEKLIELKSKHIANTFQRWLLLFILLAFFCTSWYTMFLQTSIAEQQTTSSINSTIEDVKKEISQYSNEVLLAKTNEIKNIYLEKISNIPGDTNKDINQVVAVLISLKETYDVNEINIIDSSGEIYASTKEENMDFNYMSDSHESTVYFAKITRNQVWIESYSPSFYDKDINMKYIVSSLDLKDDMKMYLQVGIGEVGYVVHMNEAVKRATQNRHIGIQSKDTQHFTRTGFIAVCNAELKLITTLEGYNLKDLEITGIKLKGNEDKLHQYNLYKADIIQLDESLEKYYYTYVKNEGEGLDEFYVIGAISVDESMYSRDSALYISLFMQIIIFAVLFTVVYFLIKKLIIDNLSKINNKLGEITSGNLDVVVDVKTNVEFASLSNDINSTVDTLKNYIAEAAARIDKELEYAKSIQLSALPKDLSENAKRNRFDIFATMIAAKEVGGDFYDYYMIDDNHIAFLVADVSGKGIPAAMFMMTAKTLIKDLAETMIDVNEVFTKANEKLCENNESGMFVTAWMGILNIKTGELKYANAGHNPPVILHDGKYSFLKTRPGLVLAGMEDIIYRVGEFKLSKGDRIFLYTDGVTEATNLSDELFGDDRLLEFMSDNIELNNMELLNTLKENIDKFADGAPQFDDITMLLFTYGKQYSSNKTFKAVDSELDNVIDYISEELEKFDCLPKTLMSISIAIEELFINVAHYAYPGSEGNVTFKFSFKEEINEATITMIDSGIKFNPLEKADPDITLSAEERQIGGLGIFITKKTMDDVSYVYKNNQNILTIKKKI